MNRVPRLSLIAALVLSMSLSACQSTDDGATAEDEAARETPAPVAASFGEEPSAGALATVVDDADGDLPICNADAVQELIGQKVTEALVEQALKDSGAGVSRVLAPNTPATLDLNPSRLNVLTDADGVIQAFRCE